ncbi:hypothetical protein EDB85DRAFT_1415624 [Lactarius pseudohatsudake]|nr:hypothetical protein EDB85DRAFT_1415624 [Lactarius pseudohatsudake]
MDPSGSPDEHDALMGSDNQHAIDPTRSGDTPAFYIALASALVLVLTTWTVILSNDPINLSWFAFHPTFNTFAIACFTFGILTLQPTSQPKTKAAGLWRHQIAMITGFLAIGLGSSAMWYNKESHGAPHITTWHGAFGSIAGSWLLVQVLVGAGSVWFGGAAFGGGHRAKLVWKYHRLSGYLLLPFLLTTVHLGGAWSTWMTMTSAFVVRLVVYTLAPLGILAALYSRVRPSKMKFL